MSEFTPPPFFMSPEALELSIKRNADAGWGGLDSPRHSVSFDTIRTLGHIVDAPIEPVNEPEHDK